jgi:hypothetical protein
MAITRSQIARQLLQQGGVSMVDPRMQQSLAQNIAVNEANREINQAMRKPGGLRDLYQKYGFSDPQIKTQFAPSMSRNPMMELANRQNLVRAIAGRSGQTGSAVNVNNFIPDTKSERERERDRIVAENQRIVEEYIMAAGASPGMGPITSMPKAIETDQDLISRLTKLTPLQATSFDPFDQLSDIDQYTLSLAYPELMGQRRDTSFIPKDMGPPTEYELFQTRFGLKKGGMPTLKDAKENAPPGEFLAYINPKEADMLRAAGGSGIMTAMGIPSFVDFGPGFTGSIDTVGPSGFSTSTSGPDTRGSTDPSGDGGGNEGVRTQDVFPNIANVGAKNLRRVSITPSGQTDTFRFSSPFVATAKVLDRGFRNLFGTDKKNLAKRTQFLRDEGVIGPGEEDEKYSDEFLLSDAGLDMLRGMGYKTIDDIIKDNDGDDTPTLFRQKLVPEPATTEPEKTGIEKVLADADEFRFLLPERFKLEDGGIVPRQGYFAGKLVRGAKKVAKKAARAVKKVAKSPLGKAALAAAALYYAPAAATRLGGANAPAGSFMRLLADQKRMAAFKTLLPGGVSPFTGETSGITKLIQSLGGETAKNITKDAAKSSLFRDLALITAPSVLAGVLAKKEEGDEDLDAAIARVRKDESGLPELLAEFDDFRFVVPEDYRQSAAEGGMMDLGGNEMDLRGGGFVPIGREEKADDVPARLSKNEFVFTADAVRAAGGGSVDKGADLMYKTMKQLENKVA